jgi:membrane fusion protein, copper/silver efflux system
MKRIVMVAALAALGCGSEPREAASPMAGMTADEHAHHMAGGAAGRTDSTGAEIRSPVQLTPAQERALGVTYTTVRRRPLERVVRTVGAIRAAEPRVADVAPKVEGFVERLHVDATGAAVRRGAPLLDLYAPMLVAAQEELLTARRLVEQVAGAGDDAERRARALLDAARRRLALWDISADQVERLERTGEVTRILTLAAPVSGVVLEKDVVAGQRVMPGMRLYRVADLSQVWVEGELFEQDLQFVAEGSQTHIEVAAYPGEHRMGRVAFIYPTVDPASRTNRVRVVVPNPDGRLKPGMFATLYFDAVVGDDAVVIPMDAVIVTGERNLVFVHDPSGALVPRQVVLGARADHFVQVLAGLVEGEEIVASANFLVDAESRLAAHGGEMPGMQHGAVDLDGATPPRPPARPPAGEHRHD